MLPSWMSQALRGSRLEGEDMASQQVREQMGHLFEAPARVV